MSYSSKSQTNKQQLRRQSESRNLLNSKSAQSKLATSKIGHTNYDHLGKISVNSPCAFHPGEKITNFCTSRECFLPLCPKCVKIHADQHIKMGIFGQFETIEQSLKVTEEGLRYSFDKLIELETLLSDIKQGYQSKIAQEKRRLRQAKNYFIEQIQNVFDYYQRALRDIESQQNHDFLQEMYNSDTILNHLTEHFQKCLKKLGSNQTLMEGIINYYSEAEEIDRVQNAQQKLKGLFPQTISITYHNSELDRIENTIKRYLDLNKHNELVWAQYKKLTTKEDAIIQKPSPIKKQPLLSPIRTIDEKTSHKINKYEPKQQINHSKHTKISELSNLQANLNLGKFKSPLDNFSLSHNRKNKMELK